MATNVLMPQLGESIAEGTIVRWNKKVGDRVDRDEPLFEVSTDKVDAEVPAPAGGVVVELRAQAGETVPVDSIVAVIRGPGEPDDAGAAEPAATTGPAAPASGEPAEAPAGRRPRGARGTGSPAGGRVAGLSPVVRRLAREHRIDPAVVTGTGAGGRVTKDDILRHAATGPAPGTGDGDGETRPLTILRRKIAEHMVLSRRTSAHVHTVFDVDFTRVAELRATHRDDFAAAGAKLTYLAFVARAVVDALVAMPIVNASLTPDGTGVVHKTAVNLGIAVALDDDEGLIVPVIRHAEAKDLRELSHAIVDLGTRARAKRLAPDEVQGGTFTITNPGAFGSIFGMPIINQPQVAILCLGAVERRPVVVDAAGTIAARTRAYLTLGFDHRLLDGAVADRFMSKLTAGIERFDERDL